MTDKAKLLYRLDITLLEEQAEIAQAYLFQHFQYGWEEENLPNNHYLIRVHCELKEVIEAAKTELTLIIPEAKFEASIVENKEWTEDWKVYFTPVQAGSFYVLPAWEKEKSIDNGLIPIYIDPKSAFGTGHHATTALCLHGLFLVYEKGIFKRDSCFLDLGCGTGILGIGVYKLGFKGICVDIDPIAIANTHENILLNDIVSGIDLEVGGIEKIEQKYDIVLANILAQPLIAMASRLIQCLKQGSCLILSGILATQAEKVIEAYGSLGKPQVIEAKDVPHICPPSIASTEIPVSETWVVLIWESVHIAL